MSFEKPSDSAPKIQNETTNLDRRQMLQGLAAIGAGASIVGQAESAEKISESFIEWRERMVSSPRAKVIEHPDVAINNSVYRLRGVSHVPETLIQNFDNIEADLEDCGTVMLEYFDSRNLHRQNSEIIALGVASADGDIRIAAEQNMYVHSADNEFGSFFGTIGGMAARKSKDVVVLNPQNDRSMRFSGILGKDGKIGGFASTAAATAFFANILAREGKNKEVTRRDFLIRGALGATGLAGAGMVAKQTFRENTESEFLFARQELLSTVKEHLENMESVGLVSPKDALPIKLDRLQKCVLDWRDITTALGILKMAELDSQRAPNDPERYAQENQPMLHYEGAAHVGVLQYLTDPELAMQRLKLYDRTFNLDGDMSIRRFHYNEATEEFDVISEVPIIDPTESDE